jgi:hypothetical protein
MRFSGELYLLVAAASHRHHLLLPLLTVARLDVTRAAPFCASQQSMMVPVRGLHERAADAERAGSARPRPRASAVPLPEPDCLRAVRGRPPWRPAGRRATHVGSGDPGPPIAAGSTTTSRVGDGTAGVVVASVADSAPEQPHPPFLFTRNSQRG